MHSWFNQLWLGAGSPAHPSCLGPLFQQEREWLYPGIHLALCCEHQALLTLAPEGKPTSALDRSCTHISFNSCSALEKSKPEIGKDIFMGVVFARKAKWNSNQLPHPQSKGLALYQKTGKWVHGRML